MGGHCDGLLEPGILPFTLLERVSVAVVALDREYSTGGMALLGAFRLASLGGPFDPLNIGPPCNCGLPGVGALFRSTFQQALERSASRLNLAETR